jgi:hypothetical protein
LCAFVYNRLMAASSGLLRVRRAVLILVLLLLLVLLVHGLAMGPHHVDESGCAVCVVVILALMALALPLSDGSRSHTLVDAAGWRPTASSAAVAGRSRHPPGDGTVLRL